jgi:hypothetical protein
MVRKIFGVIVLLGALFCFFGAYEAAGGMHGYSDFSLDRVFENRNGAGYWMGGGVLALMLALGLLLGGKKRT